MVHHKLFNLTAISIIMEIFKQEVLKQLSKATRLPLPQLSLLLETPPSPALGDFAFPCHKLSKQLKQNPVDITLLLAPKLHPTQLIERIEPKGPYINFFINQAKLAELTIKEILKKRSAYGKSKIKKQTILIEFPSPNTNKPLHLGHIRNILLGSSLANLLKFQGHKVIKVNLNNDRGVHICKSMLAYKLFGNNQQPDKKSDHFVGDFYVKFSQEAQKNPELEQQAQEMLVNWESKDPETIRLWKLMNTWALTGFQQTYKKFNLKFNKQYYESQLYSQGKNIIFKALQQEIFQRDANNNIIADLEKYGMGKKVVLRQDNTSVYITQDIYLAYLKHQDYHPARSIYIVASEQDHHFKALFKILELLSFKTSTLHHLSYGMVYLPEGRMKSREGTVVDADDLIDEVTLMAQEILSAKHPELKDSQLTPRANNIGMAALTFFILKYDPRHDFTYNPQASLSFEGETGPYLQYTYARIQSILKKTTFPKKALYSLLTEPSEKQIIILLQNYPKIMAEAAANYKLSILPSYLIELSKAFNTLYHELPILQSDPKTKAARLHLIKAVSIVLSSALAILGISALEEM